MKLTNGQLLTAAPAMRQLMTQKLPVLTSAKVVRLIQEIDIHLAVVNSVRINLVTQHATEKDPKGQPVIKANTPEMEKFTSEWAELLAQEVDVKFEGKIKLPWTIEMDPISLLNLEMFVEIPEA